MMSTRFGNVFEGVMCSKSFTVIHTIYDLVILVLVVQPVPFFLLAFKHEPGATLSLLPCSQPAVDCEECMSNRVPNCRNFAPYLICLHTEVVRQPCDVAAITSTLLELVVGARLSVSAVVIVLAAFLLYW